MSNDPDFVLFALILMLPIFLLITYLTVVMMDKHSEDDE